MRSPLPQALGGPAPEASDGVTTGKTRKIAEIKVPSYAYPAPVRGHINETNIGEFDLVLNATTAAR